MELRASAVDNGEIISYLDAALPEVYGYLLHRVRDKATAEDLTSEAMLSALQSLRVRQPDLLGVGWVIGIARHKLVDHWRREERRRRSLALLPTEPEAAPADAEVDIGFAHDVLALLSPAHRMVLTLRHVDGLSVPEVAAVIDRSVHATETLLVRARATFRDRYHEKAAAHE